MHANACYLAGYRTMFGKLGLLLRVIVAREEQEQIQTAI
jgi:hypothetical protein